MRHFVFMLVLLGGVNLLASNLVGEHQGAVSMRKIGPAVFEANEPCSVSISEYIDEPDKIDVSLSIDLEKFESKGLTRDKLSTVEYPIYSSDEVLEDQLRIKVYLNSKTGVLRVMVYKLDDNGYTYAQQCEILSDDK